MRYRFFLPGLVLFISISTTMLGQSFYRIESDITIKSKVQGGQGSLTMGRVYFDRTTQKLVYSITFPEKEVWVVKDTISLVYRNNELCQRSVIGPFTQTTMFHKCLTGSLNDFGLKDSFYRVNKVERDQNMVITTWIPPKGVPHLGKILTSTIGNNLHGVVVMNSDDEIVSRQVYKNYVEVSGLKIPAEVIQIVYRTDGEVYQITTLSNIAINNPNNEDMYNYTIDSH